MVITSAVALGKAVVDEEDETPVDDTDDDPVDEAPVRPASHPKGEVVIPIDPGRDVFDATVELLSEVVAIFAGGSH